MTSSDERPGNNNVLLLILDSDPMGSRYRCPLTTCNYQCASASSIISHMWKFKGSNSVNKTCTGQTSSSLTLYPKLFHGDKFKNITYPTFSAEYPQFEWNIIQKYIDNSPPQIVKLIQEFNIFITNNLIEKYPFIEIPKSLFQFILNNDYQEPPHKKQKVSLALPSLNTKTNIGSKCSICLLCINPYFSIIKCVECDAILICIICFKEGKECDEHKRFHKYKVLPPLTESRVCNEWRLLRQFMNNNGNSDIEDEFYDKYGDIMYLKDSKGKQRKRLRCGVDINSIFSAYNTDKYAVKCGYREYRDEFEAEWNNNAEAMIGDMYFSEYDTETDRKLKFEGMRIYNAVLKERKTRKKFIKDYGVIYKKRNKRNMTKEETKMEKEITDNLSVFARFTEDKNHNLSEFKALINGLIEEYKLRQKIDKVRHYLLNGVISVEQMQQIEKYTQKQMELKENKVEYHDIDNTTNITAKQYLNQYNGCSLDAISTYLKLINNNTNNHPIHNMNDNGNASVLNEGTKKLCNVLKIAASDYQYIEQEISKRVHLHGLLNNDKVPQQLYIDIDDVQNVKDSMRMRCGLVDAVSLNDNITSSNNKE